MGILACLASAARLHCAHSTYQRPAGRFGWNRGNEQAAFQVGAVGRVGRRELLLEEGDVLGLGVVKTALDFAGFYAAVVGAADGRKIGAGGVCQAEAAVEALATPDTGALGHGDAGGGGEIRAADTTQREITKLGVSCAVHRPAVVAVVVTSACSPGQQGRAIRER